MTTKGPTTTTTAVDRRRAATAALAGAGMAVTLMLAPMLTPAPGIARADVLDDLGKEFTTAAGAGPIADLVNQSLKLRAMGFRPSKAELDGITQAETYRPNQTPLIKALKATVAGQSKLQQETQALQGSGQNQFGVGINQYDPNSPGGVTAGPGGVNLGGGSNQFQIGTVKPGG